MKVLPSCECPQVKNILYAPLKRKKNSFQNCQKLDFHITNAPAYYSGPKKFCSVDRVILECVQIKVDDEAPLIVILGFRCKNELGLQVQMN
jgi:hypothetical protein